MIGNITRGNDFAGLGRYLYAVGEHHEAHADPRVVAADNVLRDDSRQWRAWVADMQWCAAQRPEITTPVWHCSIRAAPEDDLMGDEKWSRLARDHVEQMGLQDHPWVAVRHGDDHVHIVASRVNGDAVLWRDSHDKLRNKESMRVLEHRHQLTRVDDERQTSRLAKVTASEREKGKRLGRDPERARLRDVMHAARDAARGKGPERFEEELDRRGVLHRANVTKDRSKVQGYSVSLPDWHDAAGEQIWLKASDVDRKLSWSKLHADLGTDRPAYADAIEAARIASRGYPTQAEVDAHQRTAAQRAAQSFPHPPQPARGTPASPTPADTARQKRTREQEHRDRDKGR